MEIPPLSQTRPCFRTSCPHPSVHRGQWSSCQTDGRSCGVGQSVRSVLCLDKFGSSLPLSACLSPGQDPYSRFVRLDTDTRTDTSCSIPCPDDVLSPQPLAGQSNCTSLCSNTSRGISISPRPLSHPLPGSNTYAGTEPLSTEWRIVSPLLTPVSLWSGRLLIGWEDTERCHVSLRAQLASYQLVPVVNMELNPHRLVSLSALLAHAAT